MSFRIIPAEGEADFISVITGLTLQSKIAFFKLNRTLSAGFRFS
jgi:hypothetical protein